MDAVRGDMRRAAQAWQDKTMCMETRLLELSRRVEEDINGRLIDLSNRVDEVITPMADLDLQTLGVTMGQLPEEFAAEKKLLADELEAQCSSVQAKVVLELRLVREQLVELDRRLSGEVTSCIAATTELGAQCSSVQAECRKATQELCKASEDVSDLQRKLEGEVISELRSVQGNLTELEEKIGGETLSVSKLVRPETAVLQTSSARGNHTPMFAMCVADVCEAGTSGLEERLSAEIHNLGMTLAEVSEFVASERVAR